MFARVQRAEVVGQPGLGIGLALSRRLAEMHGGALSVASSGEGAGSTFTLSLPLPVAAPASIGPPRQETASELINPARIVIIEDNEDLAEALKDLLEETGHRVWSANSGAVGVQLVQEVNPNVVLCDLGLPQMEGVEVCRRIRALPLAVRPLMVAVTGWGREEDRRQTREAGFDYHLVKPVAAHSLDQLLRIVTN